jgi:N-acetylglucosamine-6-phosphate deacetylase
MPSQKIYSASKIFTGENWLENHAIIVEAGKILKLLPLSSLDASQKVQQYDDCMIVPAFIDLQIYGVGGKLFAAYPEIVSLSLLVEQNKNGGTCFCLPTVATNEMETIQKCIDVVKEYLNSGGEGILGIHLEGPWINTVKRGAHIDSLVHAPSLSEVKELLERGRDVIRIITLAPEVCSNEVIDLLLKSGIQLSIGHSNANYEQSIKYFNKGIKLVTHLFNAMSSFQHRAPGLAGAAMDSDLAMASIIADGFHVDFAAIRVAKKAMKERLFAITDAVTETHKGYYPHQLAGDKYESAGVLSGSALTMAKAASNLVEKCDIELAEALRMCSLYPAKAIDMDDKLGKIAEDYQAHLLVMNNNLEPLELI